jgi:hypothetical protein
MREQCQTFSTDALRAELGYNEDEIIEFKINSVVL